MPRRPRIQWQLLGDGDALWTPGWLPETDVLRWSLAACLKVEGMFDGWRDAHETADGAEFTHGYVAEDELGDVVRVTEDGTPITDDGEQLARAQAATVATMTVPAA